MNWPEPVAWGMIEAWRTTDGRAPSRLNNGRTMTSTGIITMIAVLAFVWGGFALLVVTAVRKERRKTQDAG